jgi:hypothetical protein
VLVSIEAASGFVLQVAFDLEDLLMDEGGYNVAMGVTELFGVKRFGFSINCRTTSCSAKVVIGRKTAATTV